MSTAAILSLLLAPAWAAAQQPPADQDDLRFRMPTVTVTAQKVPEDKQKVPISVTAVSRDVIDAAGIRIVSEAAIFAPNTFFTEWSARKLSIARFRGISSSPGNPGITTYIDGVPQLNDNTASIELLDVDQIEFVRGPQSALFGRNTLGGLVNVTSARPSMSDWTGSFSVPFGNHGAWGVRGGVAGPIVANKVSFGVSVAELDRDGFTINSISGDDIDSRQAFSTKAQLLWVPNSSWETRVIVTNERARDGDYSLNDVDALRSNPFVAARDFEGRVDRDIFATTVLLRRAASDFVFTSATGIVDWTTQDVTDFDYTPLPILTRDNTENATQFTQEVRLASSNAAAGLRWQTGVFLFTQQYEQDAINNISPGLFGPIAVSQHSPRSALDDFGLGIFGQATLPLGDRVELSGGARFDYEDKSALLETFSDPAIFPGTSLDTDDSFSNVSPQVSVAYRPVAETTIYGTVSRGYKAGGFNPASPAGSESYGEEFSWNIEGGFKGLWANGRVSTNVAVFSIDWDDLQLNIPNPSVPAQFYIANVGGATSRGIEFELGARAAEGVDVFGAVGYTNAEFSDGSISSGIDVDGNRIPNTPEYTASAGLQYSRTMGALALQARGDVVFYGDFFYNDQNSLGQDAYSLVNFRLGVTARYFLGELLIRNAFDTEYIPVAFPYPTFAPSGFMGEMGAPRTVTVRAGVRF